MGPVVREKRQEAYDNSIMSFRIAEDMKVRLPVMNCLDGFIITHAIESLAPIDDEVVRKFVGDFRPVRPLLDVKNPCSWGPFDMPEYYFEHKYEQAMAMENVIPSVQTGRERVRIDKRPQI